MALEVIAPSMVALILEETVNGIGDETAQRDEHGGGEGAEHGVGEIAEMDIFTELETDIETATHETGEQGNGEATGEVEVLHGFALLLLGERLGLEKTGITDDADAQESDGHAKEHGKRERGEGIELGEEHIEQHGAEDGAQTGTGAEGNALAEGHTEVTHGEAEREAAHAPEDAEEDGHPDIERLIGAEQLAEAMTRGHGEQGAEHGEHQPGEDALNEPVALPRPLLDLVDGDVAATLAEGAHRYY